MPITSKKGILLIKKMVTIMGFFILFAWGAVLDKPLVERYILDELKTLRQEHHALRTDVERRITKAEIDQTDRAARYVTDMVGNIFYLIAAATSLLIFAGWNSLRDIRKKTETIVEARIEAITKQYHEQLERIQEGLTQQSKKILENQNRIYDTQLVHSLWMRANLETSTQSKIEIYDEILSIATEDAEVYAYKADAVLDLDEYEWALRLSNKAIEIDPNYGYAYWQRACAHAMLGNTNEALHDLKNALGLAPNLREEMMHEPYFEAMRSIGSFQALVNQEAAS